MNEPDLLAARTISLTARREFDRICDGFERAWRSGGQPRLEDYLPEISDPARSELTRQLIEVEIEQRTSRGDIPSVPDYVKRFPAFSAWLHEVMQRAIINATPALRPGEPQNNAGAIVGRSFGQYSVIDKLGEGGMGAVFRVRHTMIDCERALKVLKPGLASNEQAIKRFLTEAQACIGLTHPNVVATYDVGQNGDGAVYLVMELLDGQNLDELVRARGPLDYSLAAEIIRQAAAGLESAHRHGAVHRDVKPHNIMWTSAKTAKILDLGLARIMDEPAEGAPAAAGADDRPWDGLLSRYESRLTDGKTLLGILAYISPEQAADARQADAQSDVYSLGCTFYYLLTGRHAFTGKSPAEILDKHMAGNYDPIARRRPDIPAALDAIAERMMHNDRARRFASSADVQNALERWLSPAPARTTTPKRATTFNIDDPRSMRAALTSLKIVSENDWSAAQSNAERPATLRDAATLPPAPEIFRRQEKLSPGMAILLELWRLGGSPTRERGMFDSLANASGYQRSEPGGEKRGLSEFQIRHLLNGHIDMLRLPQHVLLDQFGSGWKGDAFKARNLETDRCEALRTLAPRMLEGLPGEGNERIPAFIAAAEELQSLSHPALAKVRGGGAHDNRIHGELVYLAAEFIDGQTLAERTAGDRANGAGSPSEPWGASVVRGVSRFFNGSRGGTARLWGAAVIREVCRGLEYAHENGALHLDIHAGAIIIDLADRPVLLDLGLARLLTPRAKVPAFVDATETLPLTAHSTKARKRGPAWHAADRGGLTTFLPPPPIGTPGVMPPEQWHNREDVSVATDIYNLGCTLFRAVTGEYPFAGQSAMELMQKHLHSAPLEVPAAKRLPRRLRPVVAKCLAKTPRERYASAKDLGMALDEVLATEP